MKIIAYLILCFLFIVILFINIIGKTLILNKLHVIDVLFYFATVFELILYSSSLIYFFKKSDKFSSYFFWAVVLAIFYLLISSILKKKVDEGGDNTYLIGYYAGSIIIPIGYLYFAWTLRKYRFAESIDEINDKGNSQNS